MASFDFSGIGLLQIRFRDGPCESVRMQSEETDTLLGPGSAEYSILSHLKLPRWRSLAGRHGKRERYLDGPAGFAGDWMLGAC